MTKTKTGVFLQRGVALAFGIYFVLLLFRCLAVSHARIRNWIHWTRGARLSGVSGAGSAKSLLLAGAIAAVWEQYRVAAAQTTVPGKAEIKWKTAKRLF